MRRLRGFRRSHKKPQLKFYKNNKSFHFIWFSFIFKVLLISNMLLLEAAQLDEKNN